MRKYGRRLDGRLCTHFGNGCVAAKLAIVTLAILSARTRYRAGCVALLLILAAFLLTLNQFLFNEVRAASDSLTTLLAPRHQWPKPAGIDQHFFLRTFVPLLAPIWLAGVCVFYGRFGVGWILLRGLRRRATYHAPVSWQRRVEYLAQELKVSRTVRLLESLLVDGPAVIGYFRPIVLVPVCFLSGMSPEHVEAILLHELAHIERSDYVVNIGQRLIEALLLYHPAV